MFIVEKVKNAETVELITTLRSTVVQKDALIERLGATLKNTEEQTKEVILDLKIGWL